ncbi:hypothetical protein [Actinoplanes regularis]|uniref:hypothetical protein n=1 Tax=Actinoplanes regularis TaxID=52697 RepID=UPI002556FE08|nr:hypothetical protein [Actinoplanes regularis]
MISSFDADNDLAAYLGDSVVASALEAWAGGHALRVAVPPEPWRRRGGSGALLVRVRVTRIAGDRGPSDLLMKVCSPGSPAGEPAIHERAWQLSPTFARRHLFRQAFPATILQDGRVLMYLDSSESLVDDRTLGELPIRLLVDCATATIRLVWGEWNGRTRRREVSTVADVLRCELRGAFDKGRSAYRWLQQAGFDVEDAQVQALSDASAQLNAMVSLLVRGSELGQRKLEYFCGNSHGDLHLDNVIVPFGPDESPDPGRIKLIDLSGFSPTAPLTRDLATLLTSCALKVVRKGVTPAETSALVDALTASRPTAVTSCRAESPAVKDMLGVLHAVRSAALAEFDADLQHLLHAQYLLSLIAQAITYTSYRNIGHFGRRWYFELGISAAERFVAFYDSGPLVSSTWLK